MRETPNGLGNRGVLAAAIVDLLRSGRHGVRFVAEMEDTVLSLTSCRHEDFERELSELEGAGGLIVRPQYCADPHMQGTDLRLAAIVDDQDADTALGCIQTVWQDWLKGYLANHRCT
jgi:hypothetical protein